MTTFTPTYVRSTLRVVTAMLVAFHVATATPPTSSSGRLVGYPGVLSREYVLSAVDEEMRKMMFLWSISGGDHDNIKQKKKETKSSAQKKNKGNESGRALQSRDLKKDDEDFSGLNDILQSFEFEIPEQVIEQEILGATATFVIAGLCDNIKVERIGLEYESSGDDLTYEVDVDNLDVDCALDIEFDFGVYDIEDELTIEIKLRDNDFALGVVLEGIPPETSSFEGCEAEINVDSINANGGFSADILSDLDYLIEDIVDAEREVISQLLCQELAGFTTIVDDLLMSIADLIAPYVGKPKSVDPLELEKNLQVAEGELVDFTNSDLGYAITVIADNLEGVVGPFQVNTLIELNLLTEDALLVIDFTDDTEGGEERRRSLQQEQCSIFRRGRRNLIADAIHEATAGRKLQEDGEEELFTVNSLDVLLIEVAGLNTFDDVDLLEIIGKQTFRTKLQLSDLAVRVTIMINADINGVNIEETVVVRLPIENIEITASYLIGLNADAVEDLTVGRLLDAGFNNFVPCILSTLQVAGVSELTVTVGEVGTPTVEGALSSGVDELINTATEAAFIHYQELLLEAVPNIFQNNVTVAANDFLECYVRTEAATAVCPEPVETQGSSIIPGLFRRLGEYVHIDSPTQG